MQLDEIVAEESKSKQEEQKEKTEQKELDVLLKKIQAILNDKVKEVRLSHRLTTSPVCLVRDQDALGPQMERMLKAVGQPVAEVKPIFELNPDHSIIHKLEKIEEDRLQEWTHILYEQALLAEGSAFPDPAAFVQRMNKLWMEMF